METLHAQYHHFSNKSSDINEHLPTLYTYAKECDRILETGVRGCISSWALVCGLIDSPNQEHSKYILLNDIDVCDISELLECTINLPIQIDYQWISNLNMDLSTNDYFDLVFIDTWHVYGQLKRELAKFSPITNKYIIMHDTTVDEFDGESIRFDHNVNELSRTTGIPADEISCGLGRAIDEFLQDHATEWTLKAKFTNNNGLTVLQRISPR